MAITSFQEFTDQLCQATTYDESFTIYSQFTEFLGYEAVLYSFIPRIVLDQISHLQPKFSISENYDQTFLEEYFESKFYQTDYVIKKIKNGCNETLDWWDDCKKGKLNTKQIKILNIMRNDYKIENGLTIPLNAGVKGIAAISVTSDQKSEIYQQLKSETYSRLKTASTIFHNHVITNTFESNIFMEPIIPNMNKTEKKVLKFILDGHPVPIIAKELCKSKGYMENVVRSIRIKMAGLDSTGKPKISKDLLIYYCGLMGVYNML